MNALSPALSLLWLLAPCVAVAQDVVALPKTGECAAGYFAYRQACVSEDALRTKGNAAVAQSIHEFLEQLPPPPRIAVCKTRVQERADPLLKFEDGTVAEASGANLGDIRFRAESLLITRDSKSMVALFDKLIPVKLLQAPSSCDVAATYTIDSTTSDPARRYTLNGHTYQAGSGCAAWDRGDEVAPLGGEGSPRCESVVLINLTRLELCRLTCP